MAKSKSRKKARRAKPESANDRADRLRMELIGVQAAVSTVRQVLLYQGKMGEEMATLLSRGALNPLESTIADLGEVAHG